jgi:hypothetical protein
MCMAVLYVFTFVVRVFLFSGQLDLTNLEMSEEVKSFEYKATKQAYRMIYHLFRPPLPI